MFDRLAYELVYYFAKFRALIVVILVLLLTMAAALSEPRNGASFIGMCSPYFPCDRALNSLPPSDKAIGYLAGSFGWKCDCVEQAINRFGNSLYLRVHVVNGTCFPSRGRICVRGEFFYGLSSAQAQAKLVKRDPKLLRRFRALVKLSERQTDGAGIVRFSPCLECKLSNPARRRLLVQMKRVLGTAKGPFVDNPVGFPCLSDTICERHGDMASFPPGQLCIADNDGTAITDDNLWEFGDRSRMCEARLLWFTGFNLLPPQGFASKKDFVPPRRRVWETPPWQLETMREYLELLPLLLS